MEASHQSKGHRKGVIIVERVSYQKHEPTEFENMQGRDLNLRPIAYLIFSMTAAFICFIAYLISRT